ncbi:MAG: penicillin-binding transpeptidase domain-containing protein [Candidatus Promineifilaceae bacterium]|nr:penicillin-binding transpeptidase domain-containing protein [Candidatus Promineifilaceae bacterium]
MYRERQSRFERLSAGLLLGFFLVAVALTFWSIVRSQTLTTRGDNPRRVEEELRIRRGRILDTDGAILAETVGPEEAPQRVYPIPGIGPAVGYYSFRYGTAGVEQGYDAVLRGEGDDFWPAFWRRFIHQTQHGRDIRLTLDADWQRTADALLGQRNGSLVLLTLPDGAIRAMVSHPAYDPNRLAEQFETLAADADAPLLNRATQGQYQPGLVLQPFILAAAVERELVSLEEVAPEATRPVVVRDQVRTCTTAPAEPATWAAVLQAGCPRPVQTLADELARADLREILRAFGFLEQPAVPLNTADVPQDPVTDLQEDLIGQGDLAVTPLQVALAWAALGNGGMLPDPQLVSAEQGADGTWQAAPTPEPGAETAVSQVASTAVLGALPTHQGAVREMATLVLAGPERTDAWYLALAPAGAPRYALVVVVEETADPFSAQQAGRALLNFILERS